MSGGRPRVSAVVASFSGTSSLLRCLQSLAPQAEPMGDSAEIVVATNGPEEALAPLAKQFPAVRLVSCPPGSDVFRLRTLGVKQSRGHLVALTEDHVTVSPGWLSSLQAAHAAGHRIIGGPVDNGLTDRAYDWALYFCEYGIYMPPLCQGPEPAPTAILSGINIAYERALLERTASVWERELHENEVNAPLLAQGERLCCVPDAWVKSHLGMTLREAMTHLFTGGRQYGRWRRASMPLLRRAALAIASPLVPAVLFARIVQRTAARQPGRLWHLARGLPYFGILLGSWSLGEAVGYWSSHDE